MLTYCLWIAAIHSRSVFEVGSWASSAILSLVAVSAARGSWEGGRKIVWALHSCDASNPIFCLLAFLHLGLRLWCYLNFTFTLRTRCQVPKLVFRGTYMNSAAQMSHSNSHYFRFWWPARILFYPLDWVKSGRSVLFSFLRLECYCQRPRDLQWAKVQPGLCVSYTNLALLLHLLSLTTDDVVDPDVPTDSASYP